MQQLENTVVELRIIQRFGDELAARDGFDGLVGIEADERSRSVGIVIIEPDHARVFIVDLASGRAVVAYIGIGSRRCPGGIGLNDRQQGGRRSTDLSDEAGAGYKTDLRSIQALAQPGRQVDNEDSGMIRLDYHYSDRTTSFVRFNADEAVETIPSGQLIAKTLYDTKFNNGVFELLHVFSPRVVNEFKFGIDQDLYHTATLSPLPYTFSVSGFSSLSGITTSDYPSKSISF